MIELIEQHRREIEELCRKYEVKRLELFGSAARGDFVPGKSDLDFLVELISYNVPRIVDDWFGLQEELERLLGCTVQLTSPRTMKNPYFIQTVNRDRVTLYAA